MNTHPSHNRHEQEHQAAPVLEHVRLGELDADREHADGEHDARELERDRVRGLLDRARIGGGGPRARVEYVGAVWACRGGRRENLSDGIRGTGGGRGTHR